MGILSRCSFKISYLFRLSISRSRTVTSLIHDQRPVHREETESKSVEVKIDKATIAKLERISLVDFDNESGIKRLEAAIRFAQKLREVPLSPSVEPMYSVLENEKLELRKDEVTEGNCRKQILKNAKNVEDEYFVAPPGNIPKSS